MPFSRIRYTLSLAAASAVVALASSAASRAEARPRDARVPLAAMAVAPRTVWDSVFTEDQATRGRAAYTKNCGKCHGEKLEGLDDAAPLAGEKFIAGWAGKTLKDIFEQINTQMPPDDPGVVDKQDVTDILAWMLSFNKFPAGAKELEKDPAFLAEITVLVARP